MTAENDAPAITEGNSDGRVLLRLDDGILHVSVEGEAQGSCLIAAFRKGIDAGWVVPGLSALVDLTRFTGVADWASLRAIRDLAPWDQAPQNACRVAYLIRHSHFGMLIQIVSAIFTGQQHKAFTDAAKALAWLRQAS